MINFTLFPVIETKKLVLRRFNYDDLQDIYKMRSNPKMIEFTDSKLDESLEETKSYIEKMNKGIDENKWIICAIEYKKSKKAVGLINIWNINLELRSGELGYGIVPEYQNKGLMKEALLSIVDYAFNTMNLKTIEAYTEENNINSIKLLESCRFNEIKRVKEDGYYSNRIYNMIVYEMKSK